MIEIPFSSHFVENMDRTNVVQGAYPCVICGRGCRNPRYRVYVDSGFTHILTPEEFATDAGEFGLVPLGADCLRKHPELESYVQVVRE